MRSPWNFTKLVALMLCQLWLTLAALPLPATAEDSLLLMLSGDEQLVSIATGAPQPVSKAPSVATVITAEDIKATGSTDLSECWRRCPACMSRAAAACGSRSIRFAAILTQSNPEVLVMVNGVPITTAFMAIAVV